MEDLLRYVQNQDWSELRNEGAMTAPTDLDVAIYRIRNNAIRFRAQYTIIMAGIVAVYLATYHLKLFVLLVILLAGIWHRRDLLLPCLIIIAVIVLTNFLAVFYAALVAVLVVCVHGAILDPDAAPNRRR